MSQRAPSARMLIALRASLYPQKFVCSSCASKRTFANGSKTALRRSWMRPAAPTCLRRASQIAPVTTVNAQKSIAPEYREIYEALKAFEDSAGVYTNLSQLQLALRGLESRDSVVRVAVLGLSNQAGPHRLVRALLADPLLGEAEWERILEGADQDGRALLVRYGETFAYEKSHPLLRTLTIPSTLLEKHKLELLLHLTSASSLAEDSSTALLVPGLDIRTSAAGRISSVAYPVHKTILFGKGFEGLREASRFSALVVDSEGPEMVKIVVDVDWAVGSQPEKSVFLVNVTQGEKAIKELRASIRHSTDYEHDWLGSHVSDVGLYLTAGTVAGPPSAMKPALRNLVSVLLADTEAAVTLQENEAERESAENVVSETNTRRSLHRAITSWAELAHTELRDELETVFSSRSWRKLAWWKLPWRIDDVEMIASEVLRRTYLINAEKGLIFVAGRMEEAGLLGQIPTSAGQQSKPLLYAHMEDIPTLSVSDLQPTPVSGSDSLDNPKDTSQPAQSNPLYRWPQDISAARLHLLQVTVPALTALAQRFFLSSISTTALTGALSSLVYLSAPTTTVYEAGVIVALGLTWSARRLQRQWEEARKDWMQGVELEGKRVLDAVEKRCRAIVSEAGQRKPDMAAAEERSKAKERVKRAREALAKMEEQSKEA